MSKRKKVQKIKFLMNSINNGEKRKILDDPNEPKIGQRARKEKSLGPDFVLTKSIVFLVEEIEPKY